jgi:DNA-binding Lrp family transcriptional regulator
MIALYLTSSVRDSRLSGLDRRILQTLVIEAKAGEILATQLAIATKASTDKKSCRLSLRKLEGFGLIECGEGVYRLRLPESKADPVLIYQSTASANAKALYGYTEALRASGVYFVTVDRLGRALMLSEADVATAIAELSECTPDLEVAA